MRLGIFGGTFDPVHVAHLILAEQCREQGRLDEVRFLVAARPPHKPQPLATFAQRVEMLTLAVSGQPAFRVEEIERDRPGPSYTADTLEALHLRQPDAELVLIVGSDALHDLPMWHQPLRVVQLAELLVVARPDAPILPTAQLRDLLHLDDAAPLRIACAQVPLMAVASHDLRRRLREGHSVRYMIPRGRGVHRGQGALPRRAGSVSDRSTSLVVLRSLTLPARPKLGRKRRAQDSVLGSLFAPGRASIICRHRRGAARAESAAA